MSCTLINTMPIFISIPSASTHHKRQRGASTLETTVAIMVFLLLVLAAFESAHWLLLRQALNTALLDTARIAATQQAHPQIINEAFTTTLERLPAFALQAAPEKERWHIEKITPHRRQHQAHTGTIKNDYQALQYQQGNTAVFDDNTLHLRLHYLHKPLTPLVRTAIDSLYQGDVPIVTDVKVAMQSDQPLWQAPTTAPKWLPASTLPITTSTETTESPSPSSPTLPAWQPAVPPTTWQPPNNNSPPIIEGCDGDLCCAPGGL